MIDPNSPQWGRPAHRKRTSAPSIWPPIAEYALDSYQVKVLPLALISAILPVGGAAALLVAAVLRGTGQRRAALAVTALGIGAAAGAIGTGLAEPLPPATS